MFTTGTSAWAASSASVSSDPVRSPIAATWRERMRAVSPADSPRVSCSSPGRRTSGWPPSSTIPVSNDTRVRVEGCSNSSATLRPASASEPSGSALSSPARASSASSSAGASSAPVRKWRGDKRGMYRRPPLLVLTFNLFHGRAVPAAGRPLAAEFAGALAGWEWDVALLQEVPPWWPGPLARACGASARMALTSRNWGYAARRAIAARNPDLLAANGGGCNAILVRGRRIAEHRTRTLTRRPERRVLHAVRLADGDWVANVHASTHPPEQRRRDLLTAAATAQEWAAGAPLVFGGDLNSTRPAMPGLMHVAGHHVDHVFTNGRPAAAPAELLDAGTLSDHRPLRVAL